MAAPTYLGKKGRRLEGAGPQQWEDGKEGAGGGPPGTLRAALQAGISLRPRLSHWLASPREARRGWAGRRTIQGLRDPDSLALQPFEVRLVLSPTTPRQRRLCCGLATLGSANKGAPGARPGPPASLWRPCSRCSKLSLPRAPPDRSAPGPGHSR